jgi:hypothetical protein
MGVVVSVCALKGPKEERCQPGILLDRGNPTIPATEYLRQSSAANHFPNLLKELRQADLTPVGGLDLGVAAENFKGRADAGEDKVGAAHPFTLEVLHPIADPLWQLTQHFGPIAYWGFLGPWPTHQMDTA